MALNVHFSLLKVESVCSLSILYVGIHKNFTSPFQMQMRANLKKMGNAPKDNGRACQTQTPCSFEIHQALQEFKKTSIAFTVSLQGLIDFESDYKPAEGHEPFQVEAS